MSIKQRLSHTAAVAKWKADQQARIIKSQNKVRDIENKIKFQKRDLTKEVLRLFSQGEIVHEDLIPIYNSIVESEREIQEQQDTQHEIRNESPPEAPSELDAIDSSSSWKLICPECHKPIPGTYCPDHGVEGILPEPEEVLEETPDTPQKMICPKCKKELSVRFCPEHGVEGIPLESEEVPEEAPDTPQKMICPQCKKELSVRFCPEHGVEGIPS